MHTIVARLNVWRSELRRNLIKAHRREQYGHLPRSCGNDRVQSRLACGVENARRTVGGAARFDRR